MENQEYIDWATRIHRRSAVDRIPISGTLEVTQRCNHRCVHCYNNLPLEDQSARKKELTFDEHCRIIDEITATGCLWLLFTGGEIFARKDFLDIYSYAKQKGMLITLFTNGTLITPRIADYLVKYRPVSIEITLYGRTRRTYEQITGIEGSFERCMHAIRLLRDRQLPLKLKTMVTSLNQHELWDMKRFAENELQLQFRFDAMINPRCDCSQNPLEVRLSPAEVVELDLRDPKRDTEWREFVKKYKRPLDDAHPGANKLWQCGGGQCAFAVDAYGQLRMCVLTYSSSFDLRAGNFTEGWEKFLGNLRQKKITKQTKCVACQIRAMCGICPANADLECLDEEAPIDFLCQVAHLRAYSFGVPVPPHGDCEYCESGRRYPEMMRILENLKI